MPKAESPLQGLSSFVPAGSFEKLEPHLLQYRVHLTVTRSRATVLGDYRHAFQGKNHRISVNGNLNPYAFLITLLHELAHLFTFVKYGNKVQPHGTEWKREYALILQDFLEADIFPDEIRVVLLNTLRNPSASSCADDHLMRVLRKYDTAQTGQCLVEELHPGEMFVIRGGRIFRRGEVQRKRIRCVEASTGRTFLFSPVYEVKKIG